jgi:hypothetical protein
MEANATSGAQLQNQEPRKTRKEGIITMVFLSRYSTRFLADGNGGFPHHSPVRRVCRVSRPAERASADHLM